MELLDSKGAGKRGVMMTPEQCRAARALLAWSQQQLATAARVAVVTVQQFEIGTSQPRRATLDVIRRAFEAAGVEFIDENPLNCRRANLRVTQRAAHGHGRARD